MEKLNIGASSFLQSVKDCSNMELEKVVELYDTMRKETQLKKFCDTIKIKYREATNHTFTSKASSLLVRREKTS